MTSLEFCLLAVVTLILVSLSLLIVSFMTNQRVLIIVSSFAFLIDLVLFQGMYDAYANEATVSQLGHIIEDLRPGFRLLLTLALLAIALLRAFSFRNVRRKNLTPFSMTEAMDILPTGILFATEEGQIFQTNDLMEHLFYRLYHKPLRNAADLPATDVIKDNVPSEEPHIFQTEDGRKWMFTRTMLDTELCKTQEILAIDVTREEELLEEQNIAVEEQRRMNQLLSEYNVMVDDTIRKEELLAAKMRVHDSLGSDLIAAKMFLTAEESPATAEAILESWSENLSLLSENIGTGVVSDVLKRFYDAADHLGIQLTVEGNMPKDFDAANLIGIGIQECMTNAIQHGEATKMQVTIEHKPTEILVSYTNNGLPDDGRGHEGGGLTILRNSAEKINATMERVPGDRYCLRLHIPKIRHYKKFMWGRF